MVLSSIILPAKAAHTATVIFLHGLGDSGEGWRPVASLLSETFQHVKFILPNAPTRSVSVFQGMPAPAWFDIKSISMENPDEDEQGILEAAKSISHFIESEIDAGTPADRIVLGGFSQGAATSLYTGLTNDVRLGGVISLSGWLPLSSSIKNSLSPSATEVPIFFGHGTDDGVVPYAFGVASRKVLSERFGFRMKTIAESGPGVVFQTYQGMEHSSDPREIRDLAQWLKSVVP